MFEKLLIAILNRFPFLEKWIAKGKKFTLPGFDKVPVYEVLKFLFEEIKKDQLPTRARSIAYSFFIAFFPGMIFLFTLLPYIPLENFQVEFLKIINQAVPDQVAQDFITFTVDDLLNRPRQGLLSLGAILTLYFSTQGVVSIIESFNKTYSIYTNRNIFQLHWMAFKLTVLLFIMFVTSIVLIIVGQQLVQFLVSIFNIQSKATIFFLNVMRYLIILVLYFFSISTIYYYGPSTKKKFRFISVGSTFATIVSLLGSYLFSAYVSGIDRYDNIYGIFGSIIIFLVWIYVNAFVLLIGFELNASIYYKKAVEASEEDFL